MTEQLGLSLAPKAHADDPAAAKRAARAARQSAASHRAKILAHLEREQSYGATYRECANALRIEPAAANRRLSELHKDGKIVRLAETRRASSGVASHVYVAKAFLFGRAVAPKTTDDAVSD